VNGVPTWEKDEDLFQDEYGYLEHLALQKFNNELLDNISRVPTPINVLIEKSKKRRTDSTSQADHGKHG